MQFYREEIIYRVIVFTAVKFEHLRLISGKFQLRFQCTFPSGFFTVTVAPKIFNKSLKK